MLSDLLMRSKYHSWILLRSIRMLIRRLQNKITNHFEIINILLYITTARKAKAQDKYKIVNMVELDIHTN